MKPLLRFVTFASIVLSTSQRLVLPPRVLAQVDEGLRGTACLETTFSGNLSTEPGAALYFDADVLAAAGITVWAFDIHTSSTSSCSITVYTCVGSHAGQEAIPSAWDTVAAGTATGQGTGNPTSIDTEPDFKLLQGVTGIAIVLNEGAVHKVSTTPTTVSTADLELTLGKATNDPFALPVYDAVWNGRLCYDLNPDGPCNHSVFAGTGTMCLPPLGPPDGKFVTRAGDTLKIPIIYEGCLTELVDWGLTVAFDPLVLDCAGVRPGPVTETGWDFCCGTCIGSDSVRVGAGLGVNPPKPLNDVLEPDTLAFVCFTMVDPQRTDPTSLEVGDFVDIFGPPSVQFPDALDLSPTQSSIEFDLLGTGEGAVPGLSPRDATCAAVCVNDFDVMPEFPPNDPDHACIVSTPPCGPFNQAPIERYTADVDCNGYVTQADAQNIYDAWACGASPTPCLAKEGPVCPPFGSLILPRPEEYVAFARDRELRIHDVDLMDKKAVRLPIEARGRGMMSAFGVDLAFPEGIEIVGLERAGATSDWLGLGDNVLVPGVVRIGGYTTHGFALDETAWTPIAYLVVRAAESAAANSGMFALVTSVDDLAGVPLQGGRVQIRGETGTSLPTSFALAQPRPNPAAGGPVAIAFEVPGGDPENVHIGIYNVHGQRVRTLIDGPQAPGQHEVSWDATNDSGRVVAAGTYFFRMQAGSFAATRKIVQAR